jgi:hypothetical protein
MGWEYFNLQLFKNIPSIDANWETTVMHPAFKTNLIMLFDKAGRTMEETIKYFYN